MNDERYDVVVIGAGQAGLAIGHFLGKQGRRFTILEAATRRCRLAESLGLARPLHAAPLRRAAGARLPRRPGRVPDARRGDHHLEQYAARFQLPIVLESGPLAEKRGRRVRARHRREVILADEVVVATGPFQVPNVPTLTGRSTTRSSRTHSTGYRRLADVPEGRVLVVGGGNTGFQIAEELAASREVHLAIGSWQSCCRSACSAATSSGG